MPAGTRDDYADSWETSRSRILLEGSFHRTWYLGEHFVRQTLGLAGPIVPAPPSSSMRTADSLLVEAIVTFMARQDGDLYRRAGDHTTFIWTHLMPPLTRVRAGDGADVLATGVAVLVAKLDAGGVAPVVHMASLLVILTVITYWWPNGTSHQIPFEQWRSASMFRTLMSSMCRWAMWTAFSSWLIS